jgi:hypothetical protein
MKQTPARLRYKDRDMQRVYEAMRALANDKTSGLYQQRPQALWLAFWDGYYGLRKTPHASPGTVEWASFMAGRDHRTAENRRAKCAKTSRQS